MLVCVKKSTTRALKPVTVPGIIHNKFYLPENDLTPEQIEFIRNHSILMGRFSAEEEARMTSVVRALYHRHRIMMRLQAEGGE